MDPHFNEYLAAVAAMVETYGDRSDDHPTEFRDEQPAAMHAAVMPEAEVTSAAA